MYDVCMYVCMYVCCMNVCMYDNGRRTDVYITAVFVCCLLFVELLLFDIVQ